MRTSAWTRLALSHTPLRSPSLTLGKRAARHTRKSRATHTTLRTKQVSPHNEEEGDLQATTPRVRTGYDAATPTGYDTEPGAASRAEDDAGEEADPEQRPAAKVTVTIAGAGARDNIADFVQALPPNLRPPPTIKDGG